MTWTLGIDTSHHVAAGLARDGEPVASEVVPDTRAHGETLIPLVQRLCASAGIAMTDVSAYAVGMGPGPFTGLRVGIVAARTLASVSGRPLHGVCSWWPPMPAARSSTGRSTGTAPGSAPLR